MSRPASPDATTPRATTWTAPAFTVLLVGVLLVASVPRDPVVVAVAVLLTQVLVALAPPAAIDAGRPVAGPRALPAVVAGVVATAVAVRPALLDGASGSELAQLGRVSTGLLAGIVPAAAVGLVLLLLAHVLRRRRRVVASLGQSATLVVLATLASGWVSASVPYLGREVVVMCAAAIAASCLVWGVLSDPFVGAGVAVATGGVVAAVVSMSQGEVVPLVLALAIGVTVGALALLGQVLATIWTDDRRHRLDAVGFAGACSIALTGPMVHLAAQLAS